MKILPAGSAGYATRLNLICIGLFFFLAGGVLQADAQTGTISEAQMRWIAIQAPRPVYPKAVVDKGKAGVAVASVIAGIDGHMETVVVLEAPNPSLAAAFMTR